MRSGAGDGVSDCYETSRDAGVSQDVTMHRFVRLISIGPKLFERDSSSLRGKRRSELYSTQDLEHSFQVVNQGCQADFRLGSSEAA